MIISHAMMGNPQTIIPSYITIKSSREFRDMPFIIKDGTLPYIPHPNLQQVLFTVFAILVNRPGSMDDMLRRQIKPSVIRFSRLG